MVVWLIFGCVIETNRPTLLESNCYMYVFTRGLPPEIYVTLATLQHACSLVIPGNLSHPPKCRMVTIIIAYSFIYTNSV